MYGQPTGWAGSGGPPPGPRASPAPPGFPSMAPQMTGFTPGGMLPQTTGMPLQPQATAVPLRPQQTTVPGLMNLGGPMGGSMGQATLGVPGYSGPPPPSLPQGRQMAPQPTGLMPPMQPQATGLMQAQQAQKTGMMGSMGSQQTGMAGPMGLQQTGITGSMPPAGGLMPQHTAMPMHAQPTGMVPQQTGMPPLMAQATGMMGPMDPRMRMMALQFLPASVAAPSAGNFSSGAVQPDQFAAALAASGPVAPQKTGMAPRRDKKAIPYKLASDEKKSYEAIFRSWDPQRTGFLDGSLAQEVFGQSGLTNDQLMQIWNLADADNRGKLNIAEFQVAMGLIYRALNGNEIPDELPQDMVPTSSRDLNESVDFLKELLTRDASVRAATGINMPLPGRSGTPGKESSLYQDPFSRSSRSSTPRSFGAKRSVGDAAAYKNDDISETPVYRSAARHINRSAVRFKGQAPGSELDDLKSQLAKTKALVDGTRSGSISPAAETPSASEPPSRLAPHANADTEELAELEREEAHLAQEKSNLETSVASDTSNLSSSDLTAEERTRLADRRRKNERQLMRVAHQQLPLVRERLSRVQERLQGSRKQEARARDQRNAQEDSALALSESRFGRDTPKSSDKSETRSDRSVAQWDRHATPPPSESSRSDRPQDYDPSRSLYQRANASSGSLPPVTSTAAGPVSRTPSVSSSTSGGAPPTSGPERAQWLREQAQRKVRERMAALGIAVPDKPASSPTLPPTSTPEPAPPAEPQQDLVPDIDALSLKREEARAARHRADQESDATLAPVSKLAPTNPFAAMASASESASASTPISFPEPAPVSKSPPTSRQFADAKDSDAEDSDAEERELARREAELEQRRAERLAAGSAAPQSVAEPETSDDEEEAELVRREAELAAHRAARLAQVQGGSDSSDEDEGPEDLDARPHPPQAHRPSYPRLENEQQTNPWGLEEASSRFPEL